MSISSRFHLLSGLFFGFSGVIIGAFAAHGLKPLLSLKEITNFETGVRYQFYHAFALLVLGLLEPFFSGKERIFKWAGRFFIIGIFLFSGSLYLLSSQSILHLKWFFLGPITPVGGVFLILGWVFTSWGVYKK
jgi:uncharacterized membrane protein YgdD (TMEM256/DUF423 family)